MPGPLPKRVEERRRRNAVPGETIVTMDGAVRAPALPRGVHTIARRWYQALKVSGQTAYFEPSDWAAAVYVAEVMSRNLMQKRFSAQLFGVVWAAMDDLLTTESARRKARLQVQRAMDGEQVEGEAAPVSIEDRRRALGG